MPIDRIIFPQFGLFFIRYHGIARVDDAVACFLDHLKDPGFDPHHHALVDLEESTLAEATFMEMRRMAIQLQPFYQARSKDTRTAFYAPKDVHFGVARLYDTVTKAHVERDTGVFRTKHAALRFLGKDPLDRALASALWPGAAQGGGQG